MRKFRIRIRLKIYQVFWGVIIIASVYLLIKFAILSFSDDIGQAGIWNTFISGLCTKAMEQSSFIRYSEQDEEQDEEQDSLLLNLVGDRFELRDYVKEDVAETANVFAQNYPALIQIDSSAIEVEENDTQSKAANSAGSLSFHDEAADYIGLEYLLTNGVVMKSEASGKLIWDEAASGEQLNIGYLKGDISPAAESLEEEEAIQTSSSNGQVMDFTLEQLRDVNFLLHNFYFVDESTSVTDSLFDGEKLVSSDMTIKQGNDAPQILIYHTHSQEDFADSRPGEEDDTVVGIGTLLAKVLSEDYGYNVIHDTTYYDVIKGYDMSYYSSEAGIKKDLKENPSVEVLIDLHRNSGAERLVMIDGEETAQVMLFNGLCRDQSGPMTDLENPFLQDNLAFSLQLQIKSFGLYPGLFRTNYLKSYRYNMHFRPKSLLIEWGSVKNTVGSAKNAVEPFAKILDAVLKGKDTVAEEPITE